jgi:hypothetical protein
MSLGFSQAAASPDKHRKDCQDCLNQGLTSVGIHPLPNASIDFGAINSDQICFDFAHAIESCLDGKGYQIGALSGDFKDDRANKLVIKIDDFVSALVTLSHPK